MASDRTGFVARWVRDEELWDPPQQQQPWEETGGGEGARHEADVRDTTTVEAVVEATAAFAACIGFRHRQYQRAVAPHALPSAGLLRALGAVAAAEAEPGHRAELERRLQVRRTPLNSKE